MPADYSAALPNNMSKSSQDLIATLETLIKSANSSVDLVIYDLEHRIGPKRLQKLRPNVVLK